MQGKFYNLPEKYKYSAAFESKITQLDEQTTEKYISLAASSQENLKQYLPKNVNLNEKIDCLSIAGQSFLANKLNLNDDSVDSETAIRIAKLFPLSYIDVNHKRDNLCGVILSASYSDAETNKELTEEEVKDYKKPFAVTIGGIIWKVANPKIAETLESDKFKDSLYISWELGFTDMQLVELPKDKFNLSEGKIINSIDKIKEYEKLLRCNGGQGKLENGNKIGRIITGEVLPLGIGIVTNPAGQLTPLIIDKKDNNIKVEASKNDENIEKSKDDINNLPKLIEEEVIKAIKKQELSQSNVTDNKNSVIENNKSNKIMDKITDIKQITDESLKECKASVITDFVSEELKKANEKYLDEQKKAQAAESAKTESEQSLAKIKEDLKKLQDQMNAKAAEETKTQRLTYFDDTYELDAEIRKVIASEIEGLDEEAFNKVKSKYDLLLKDKSKEVIEAAKKATEKTQKAKDEDKKDKGADEDMEDKNGNLKKSKASVEDETIVDKAVDNGEDKSKKVANASTVEQTLQEKYAAAFSVDNMIENKVRGKN